MATQLRFLVKHETGKAVLQSRTAFVRQTTHGIVGLPSYSWSDWKDIEVYIEMPDGSVIPDMISTARRGSDGI